MSILNNMVVVDLRKVSSVEEAKKIEEMKNIACLIMPDDADPEISAAIQAIPKINVAHTLYLPKNTLLRQMSGNILLTPAILKEDGYLMVNGNAVVEECIDDWNAALIMTGNLIYPKHAPAKIHSASGQVSAYDYEHYVAFNDDFELDAATVDLLEYKTLLNIDGDLRIRKDVTLEQLKEKIPFFCVDGTVRCPQSVSAFLKLHSEIDGELRIQGAQYNDEDDED